MPETKWRRLPGSANVYSNWIYMNYSVTDVRIRFGLLIPSDYETPLAGQPESIAEEQVSVTMSWPQVKNLSQMLKLAVEAYENSNGPIELEKLKLPGT
jgi:hypothetical protein